MILPCFVQLFQVRNQDLLSVDLNENDFVFPSHHNSKQLIFH